MAIVKRGEIKEQKEIEAVEVSKEKLYDRILKLKDKVSPELSNEIDGICQLAINLEVQVDYLTAEVEALMHENHLLSKGMHPEDAMNNS